MTIEEIREKLLQGGNIRHVARKIGVHFNTLYAICNGGGTTYKTLKKLEVYFNG